MKRIYRFLSSLKLAFFLLLLLGVFLAQRAIVAQKQVLGEDSPLIIKALNSLGVDSLGDLDLPFEIVFVFFLINLTFATIEMVRRVIARKAMLITLRREDTILPLGNSAVMEAIVDPCGKLSDYFRKEGFRDKSIEEDGVVIACYTRRLTGVWGGFLFHSTFFILLLAGAISYYTKQSGLVELTPGEEFLERRENYLWTTERPKFFSDDRGFKIRLDEIDLSYWKPGDVKQRATIVSLTDASGRALGQKRIEINSPFTIDGRTIYQGKFHGFKAYLEFSDSEGNVSSGTAHFKIPEKKGEGLFNRIRLPGTGLELELELITDKLGRIEGLESFTSGRKGTTLKFEVWEGRRRFGNGYVFPGTSSSFEGLEMKFISLKPYSTFLITQDFGVPIMFAGFAVLVIGLLVTYFWVPEVYWVAIRKDEGMYKVTIGAATERYQDSFRESFGENISELKELLIKT